MTQAGSALREVAEVPARLPEGVEVLRDGGRGQVILVRRPKCPYCGTAHVRCYKTMRGGRLRYYRCTRCVHPQSHGQYTQFKAIVE